MAKLVEIVVGLWPNAWRAGKHVITQNAHGDVLVENADGLGVEFGVAMAHDLADDYKTAVVTRAQWEAERSRIATNQQATAEAREIARTGAMSHHLETLAQELRDAAQKYCDATGVTFTASFNFIDATNLESVRTEIAVNVEVESTLKALA